MATICLTWKDLNLNEDGFNIYRSESPMDVENMPTPLATVAPNVGSYDDTTGIDRTLYYYRIGVIRGDTEAISDEITRVFGDTINTPDIFGDSSIVATYQLDGNGNDLGGNYNLTASPGVSFQEGLIGTAAFKPTAGNYLRSTSSVFNLGTTDKSFSLWAKLNTYNDISPDNQPPRFFSKTLYGESNTRYSLGIYNNGNFALQFGDNIQRGNYQLPLNDWYHITLVIERDISSRLYVDGELVESLSPLSSTINMTNNFQFGLGSYNNRDGIIDGQVAVIDGLLDQFRIFNRVLNDNEIQLLYQERFQ